MIPEYPERRDKMQKSGRYRPEAGDLMGGFAGAAVVLPQAMGLGIVLFSVMGYEAAAGAAAGLLGATILLLVSGGAGATIGMISAPNGPMTMLLVGIMGALAAEGGDSHTMILTLGAILILTGFFQIIFTIAGGAQLIKYIPYPVVAGLVTGVGLLMVKSQIGLLTKEWHTFFPTNAEETYPPIIAVLSMAAMVLTPKMTKKRLPGAVGALTAGIIVFYLFSFLFSIPVQDSWVVGTIPSLTSIHFGLDFTQVGTLPYRTIILSAMALTVLGMTDCLVTSLVADSKTGTRHDSRMEMIAQGAAEVIIGLSGALGGWGTKGATLVSIEAGGRRYAAIAAGIFFLMLMLWGGNVGNWLPISVLAGIVAMVGLGMMDWNILSWLRHKRTRADALVALTVIIVIVSVNLVTAVGVGVLISILLFIGRQTKTSIIHRRVNAREHRSIVKRSEKEEEVLDRHGEEIVMYELKDNLFFATADKLRTKLSGELTKASVLILHFRRVRYIDMSAMIVLLQLSDEAEAKKCELVFCHLHKGLGFGKKAAKAFSRIDPHRYFNRKVFRDTDTAFEYAENLLLEKNGIPLHRKEFSVSVSSNDFCLGMPPEAIGTIAEAGNHRKFEKKTLLFNRGDYGDSLFLVLEGEVEIRLSAGRHEYKRLAKYNAGTYFGEISFISPGPRAASAVILGPGALLELKQSELKNFENIEGCYILTEIFKRISIRQSEELRRFAEEIRRLEKW